MTWIKLFAFTYNLKLDTALPKIIWIILSHTFCCCCCCFINKATKTKKIMVTASASSPSLKIKRRKAISAENKGIRRLKSAVAGVDRPLDLIGFYGNMSLFLPDIDDIDKSRNKYRFKRSNNIQISNSRLESLELRIRELELKSNNKNKYGNYSEDETTEITETTDLLDQEGNPNELPDDLFTGWETLY